MRGSCYFFYFLVLFSFQICFGQQTIDTLRAPGFGVDMRFLDPLDPGRKSVIRSVPFNVLETENKLSAVLPVEKASELRYEFVQTAYDFEQKILGLDAEDLVASANFSQAYNSTADAEKKDQLLYVYTLRKKSLFAQELQQNQISEKFKDAVARLGRDLTAEGFLSWFGTHYTTRVTYGGLFLTRNIIRSEDFVNSPYSEKEFKTKLLIAIGEQQRGDTLTDPYIQLGPPQRFTRGGDSEEIWDERWEQTVTPESAQIIEATYKPLTTLLTPQNFPELDDIAEKRVLLETALARVESRVKNWQAQEHSSSFFQKYSLRFRQKAISVVKNSMGTAEESSRTNYVGDLFFGSFNANGEPMNTKPLIEYQGIDLNTLLTDEEIALNKILDFTISPEELKGSYVSIWDDTKKLVKGENRTPLFISGPETARTAFKEALVQPVFKEVQITTIDNDVFTIKYSLEQLKEHTPIVASGNPYNYALDSELVAAAARGDTLAIVDKYLAGASRAVDGVIAAAVQNFDDATVLNTIFDFGVQPTTSDLDLVFDADYFSKEKALTLLERGAKPKNNMIFKAVAYKAPEVIYALLREGAKPVNNDIAFAVRNKDYKAVKALMSDGITNFTADTEMLALAVTNADADLVEQFIEFGAEANATILEEALKSEGSKLVDQIKKVTTTSTQVLEVVAQADDTPLFSYFLQQGEAQLSDKVITTAITNSNLVILGQALDQEDRTDFSLEQAILFKNTPAVRLSLEHGANAAPAFDYAAAENDFTLFKENLDRFNGDPKTALRVAVKYNQTDFAKYVFQQKEAEVDPNVHLTEVVKNENQELVEFLISKRADPQLAVDAAIQSGNSSITHYLIEKGAVVENPNLLKSASKSQNIELAKVLLETRQMDPDAIMLDLIALKDAKLVETNLSYGAQADAAALRAAVDSKSEEIALKLIELAADNLLTNTLIFNAVKNGMPQVVSHLIDRVSNPDYAYKAALETKQAEMLNLSIAKGAVTEDQDLFRVMRADFQEAVPVLLDAGLDPKVLDLEGNTLLHYVVYKSDKEDLQLIEDLLDYGLNINAKNKIGETPLHWAVKGGNQNTEIIKKLLSNGALVEAQTIKRQTVYDYAEDKSIRQLLKESLYR
mgnify:CR=1 FL=1